jgi:hypothetical protein
MSLQTEYIQRHGLTKPKGKRRWRHGRTGTRLYGIWKGIVKRCYNVADKRYHRYGGRGITVCAEWKDDPVAFIKWAETHGYAEDLQIDRADNNVGYSPENCRFVTAEVNARNRAQCVTTDTTVKVVVGLILRGKTYREISQICGISFKSVYKCAKRGAKDLAGLVQKTCALCHRKTTKAGICRYCQNS